MKKLLLAVLVAISSVACSEVGEATWLDDYETAKQLAAKENKPILINFTGSNWCGLCIALKKEVFDKDEFKIYAQENLVLMEVDFPENKEQSVHLKAQNEKLDKEFKTEGYPTLFLLDAEGNKLTEDIGYRAGGAEAYVAHLKSLLKK